MHFNSKLNALFREMNRNTENGLGCPELRSPVVSDWNAAGEQDLGSDMRVFDVIVHISSSTMVARYGSNTRGFVMDIFWCNASISRNYEEESWYIPIFPSEESFRQNSEDIRKPNPSYLCYSE